MSVETAGIIASAISTTFAAIAIFLAWRTLIENHEWNRRKSTDDALRFLVSGDYQRLTDQFHTVVPFKEWSKVDTSYKDICESLTEEERAIAIKCSWDLLNIFESICIGMNNSILDEDIAYDYLRSYFLGSFTGVSILSRKEEIYQMSRVSIMNSKGSLENGKSANLDKAQ